ncbi:MAG: protoporphyrin/coproporphyrin ferrochelatase [Chloroflexota bacterium]|nr:protoporphyrin/coproporphyrin ferrochelatase [Chloroflexota bacterium]
MSGRLGVLLMTYGSPAADLHDLPQYLAAVRGGREPSSELVDEFRRRYELIGGSPLVPITRAQAAAVGEQLRAHGHDAAATVGMRFSAPSVPDGLRELAELGCERVSAIVMSPQYSGLLMDGYRIAIDAAVAELGPAAPSVQLAPAWHRKPGFIAAVAERIRDGLASLPDGAPVLLTAHSLPRRVADAEPGYLDQLRGTAEAVASAVGLGADRWHFCWQSAGHEPGEWMVPDFTDLLPQLRDAGHTAVLIAPIQFLADHLEILYDVDIAARQQAEAAGMAFARIESLNVSPIFIGALAQIAREASQALQH